MQSRIEIVQANLVQAIESTHPAGRRLGPDAPIREGTSLTAAKAVDLFRDQVRSRELDVASRRLKQDGQSFYTISSAGHEQNAVLGDQLRLTDPCFLHYRSGGLMMARLRKDPDVDPVLDTMLSFVASSDDPVSGGRHKVWGSRSAWVPPQTSTIASHLPKAMGTAVAIGRRRQLGLEPMLPPDSVVLCSFGDASASHATALSGINAARYAFRRGNPCPVLFVCEDNRVGISVAKPRRWIVDSFGGLSQLEYYSVTSGNLVEVWDTVETALRACRERRRPVFLRIPMVRLWGHAGSDVETTYRSIHEIEEIEAQDPLLHNARFLIETGASAADELLGILEQTRGEVNRAAEEAVGRPKLASAEEVIRVLAPYDEARTRRSAGSGIDDAARLKAFGGQLPEEATAPTKRTMAAHINSALADEMLRRPEVLMFGEDVAKKGGVYYVTAGLQDRFGRARVFDTLLDETTILGLAQGMSNLGLLPIPEIQYLAYLHNAIDQLRGEACSLQFFSNGQFQNPMVVRIAGLAYQKGFGGHFHNDNAVGALREIPGLILAVPSRGDDAARMLRGVVAAAQENGRVAVFLEPIALYHEKDLHREGDGGWLSTYPDPHGPEAALLPGEVGVYHPEAADLLVVSYANGLRMSLRAARILEEKHGIKARVLDLRWLSPLPSDAVRHHANQCERVLVVDECRAAGGVADALLASLCESGLGRPVASVRSRDTYIPLGPAADTVLVNEEGILDRALELCRRG